MFAASVSQEVWLRFKDTRCEITRDQIVQRNLPLVRSIARRIQQNHGGSLDIDDLVQSGCVGLLGAVDSFDPERGRAFSSFAVPRIRGAILDELRKQDSSTRLSRTRKRAISAASRAVSARELRAADEVDTAKQLGVDVATLHEWRAHVQRGTEASLDRPLRADDRLPTTLGDLLPDEAADQAEAGVAFEERRERLAEAMLRLPERQRLVLHLYYYERLQQTRIAEILGVTESRISQIRTRTLALLRSSLDESEPIRPGSNGGSRSSRSGGTMPAWSCRVTVRSRDI